MRVGTTKYRPRFEPLEDRTVPSTVAADLGSLGLWAYTEGRIGWTQLTPSDPFDLDVNRPGEVLADLNANGLYLYSGGTWNQLTPSDPSAIALADNGDVFAAFPGYGLMHWNGAGWVALTTNTPSALAAGETSVAADYDGLGLWTWTPSQGWYCLTTADPSAIAFTEYADGTTFDVGYCLAADFGGLGLWRNQVLVDGSGSLPPRPEMTSAAWEQLTPSDPSSLDVDWLGNVAAAFVGYGVYRHGAQAAAGTWALMTNAAVETVSVGSDGDIYTALTGGGMQMTGDPEAATPTWYRIDFGTAQQFVAGGMHQAAGSGSSRVAGNFGSEGVWRYQEGKPGWEQLTPSRAEAVAVNSQGHVLGDFGGLGLHLYRDGAWQQLTPSNPSAITIADQGDVFAAFPGYGLMRWTVSGGWMVLSGNVPSQIDAGQVSLAADYDGLGLWTWSPHQGWYKMADFDPSDIALTEYQFFPGCGPSNCVWQQGYILAADRDGQGLWANIVQSSYQVPSPPSSTPPPRPNFDATKWVQTTPSDPADLDVNYNRSIYNQDFVNVTATFFGYGIFRYRQGQYSSPTWSLMKEEAAMQLAVSGDGSDIYATLPGGYGLQVTTNAETTTPLWSVLTFGLPDHFAAR